MLSPLDLLRVGVETALPLAKLLLVLLVPTCNKMSYEVVLYNAHTLQHEYACGARWLLQYTSDSAERVSKHMTCCHIVIAEVK